MGASANSGGARRTPPPRVTIYTTPSCHWCRVAKRYFAEHHVQFREIDVMTDKRGLRDMLVMTGQRGVPVIRVGERALVGWDAREFERLYHKNR